MHDSSNILLNPDAFLPLIIISVIISSHPLRIKELWGYSPPAPDHPHSIFTDHAASLHFLDKIDDISYTYFFESGGGSHVDQP